MRKIQRNFGVNDRRKRLPGLGFISGTKIVGERRMFGKHGGQCG